MAINQPLVSVLMTAYNREKYIAEAIESVLSSTYTNFELIIVDDCSTDRTLEIAEHYESKDNRVKVYKNEKNLGDYPNRNKAAGFAKGKYLKYIDADDMIYPNGLEIIVRNMEIFPNAGWGLMSLIQDDDRIFPFQLSPVEAYRRNYLNKSSYINSPGIFYKAPLSAIILREAFENIGGFKNVRHYGDSDLWHRLAMRYPVVLMQDGLVWWRGHEDQEAKKRKSKIHVYFETVNNCIENISDFQCPLDTHEKTSLYKSFRNAKLKVFIKLLLKMKVKSLLMCIKYI